MSKVLLLVDWSNILYRAYYSSKSLLDLKPWLPILRYVDMMRMVGQRVHHHYGKDAEIEVIFAGESRKKLSRAKVDASYKSHRKPVEDLNFRTFRQHIIPALEECGWNIITRDGAEADDVIASIAAKAETDVVVFSNDRDLRQLLCFPYVAVYQHPGIFYTPKMFLDDYGIDINDFVYYKALIGDKSDNIPGVFGWGPAKAKKYILSQTWVTELKKAGQLSEYNHSLELSRLDFSLEVPINGEKFARCNNFDKLDEIIQDYKKLFALTDDQVATMIADIHLCLNRLEEIYILKGDKK